MELNGKYEAMLTRYSGEREKQVERLSLASLQSGSAWLLLERKRVV
jgi:hypothetical protein